MKKDEKEVFEKVLWKSLKLRKKDFLEDGFEQRVMKRIDGVKAAVRQSPSFFEVLGTQAWKWVPAAACLLAVLYGVLLASYPEGENDWMGASMGSRDPLEWVMRGGQFYEL